MAAWITANLFAFSLQLALIVLTGIAVAALFRVRSPGLLLWHDYAMLLIGILVPIAGTFWPAGSGVVAGEVASFTIAVEAGASRLGMPVASLGLFVLAGAALRVGWLIIGIVRLSHLRRAGEPFMDSTGTIDSVERRLGVYARWVVCDRLGGPATYGLMRPVVLLPRAVAHGDLDVLRMAVCHELLHVRRRDWWCLLGEELVRSALWFHPCVWLALSRVHLHREQVVDHATIAVLGDARAYARALIEGVARSWSLQPAHMAPGWLKARHVRARVASISKGVEMSKSRMTASAVMVLAVLIGSAWGSSRAFPLQAAGQSNAQVYTTRDGVTLPKLVSQVKPGYTPEAMKAKIQGELVVDAVVKSDGTVGDVTVTRSLDTLYGLDESGVDAARQWRFEPGTKDGKPVNVRVEIMLRFTLK